MQLGVEILVVEEAALLEEGALDPTDEILDGALLIGAVRPAGLYAETELEHHRPEGGIPFRHCSILAPLEGDGPGPIEHGNERDAPHSLEVVDHGAHERLHALVRHQ